MGPTLIGLLQESVVKYASLAAVKSKNPDGTFATLTYAELYTAVKELGTGLVSVGLARGMHAAIVAENTHRWLVSDLAVLGSAAIDVPLSARLADADLEQCLAHCDCEIALVEDPSVLARLLAMRRRLPRLRKIVAMDLPGPKPFAGSGTERVMIYTWEDVLKKGRARIQKGDRQFDLRAAGVTSTDTATILYTSGTTGRPRGVMLTHGNIMHNVTTVQAALSPEPGSTWLSILPVWHSFERAVEYCSIFFGSAIAYSQPSDWKIFDDLRTQKPEYLVVVPSLLEAMQKSIEKRFNPLDAFLVRFEKFYLVFSGYITGRYPRFRREERLLEIFAAILPLVILSPVKLLSHLLLRRRMRALVGGNLRGIVCGGGPLSIQLDRFFTSLGIDILEGYGLTEASPIVSVRSEKQPVLGTVGRPLPDTEVRIVGESGESLPPGRKGTVHVKGPQVMQGYYRDPAATREMMTADGWLDTGDVGLRTIDGNLMITGRAQSAIVLRSGERVEPEPLETVVQESPYIQEAVVVGDARDNLGILVVPAMDALRPWASSRGIHASDTELVHNPAVFRFYQEEVQARLAASGLDLPGGRAARLALLPATFEVGRELTRTLSKRRLVIAELYAPVIEALFRG
jgi:long-chain acyl-CoA synthetase